jgi:hypothetical protein
MIAIQRPNITVPNMMTALAPAASKPCPTRRQSTSLLAIKSINRPHAYTAATAKVTRASRAALREFMHEIV